MSVSALLDRLNTAGKTAAELAVEANAASIQKTNTSRLVSNELAEILGYPVYLSIYNKLKGAGQQPMIDMLSGKGIPFAHQNVRDQLDQLVAGNILESEEGEQLKSLGIWHVTPWSEAGGDDATPVTAEEIQAELNKRALLQIAIDRYNAARDGLDNGTITTLAELKAVLAGV